MMRRSLGRGATLVTAVCSALALVTAPAFATVNATTSGGNQVLVTSDGDGDSITMSCMAGSVAVNFAPAAPAIPCAAAVAVSVNDNGGTDTINLGSVSTTTFPALTVMNIDVEDGAIDTVTGSAIGDQILGNFGDIIAGGPGDDRIEGATTADGGDGDDVLIGITDSTQGGPGNDRIDNPGNGPVDGGTGNDSAELDLAIFSLAVPISVVVSDSQLTLTIATNPTVSVQAASIEQWLLTMTPGAQNDVMDSRTFSGRMVFRGLSGDDTFLGGAGSDYADGGSGNDSLTPGAGSDAVYGGDGNDTVNVRDGVADIVDCGAGTDSVTADRVDVLGSCENVSLPSPETDKVAGPKKVIKGEKATFTFGSSTAGATFECQVDKGSFKACSSPFKVKTKKLKAGKHTLSVRAVQPAGNADATPSTFKFKVTAPKH